MLRRYKYPLIVFILLAIFTALAWTLDGTLLFIWIILVAPLLFSCTGLGPGGGGGEGCFVFLAFLAALVYLGIPYLIGLNVDRGNGPNYPPRESSNKNEKDPTNFFDH